MNIEYLFMLFSIFGIGAIISGMRNHWMEFSFFLFVTFFSAMGFLLRLIA